MTSSTTTKAAAGNPWIRNQSATAPSSSPSLVFVVSTAPPPIIGDHSWPSLTASERQGSSSAAPPGGEGSQPMTTTVPGAHTITDPAINPNPNNRRGGGRNHHHHSNNHQNYRSSYVNRGPGLYSLSDSMQHIPFHPNGMPPPQPVHYWSQQPPLPPLGWDVYLATTNVVHRPPPPSPPPHRPLPPPLLQNGHHRPVLIDPNLQYHHPVPFQHHMLAGMITTPPLLVLPPPSVQAKLMGDIRKQIEYYFSEENLTKDVYLKQHMDNCGWVDLDVIGKFNRVKALTQDRELVRRSLMVSDVIELEGFKIRRRNNWRRWILG